MNHSDAGLDCESTQMLRYLSLSWGADVSSCEAICTLINTQFEVRNLRAQLTSTNRFMTKWKMKGKDDKYGYYILMQMEQKCCYLNAPKEEAVSMETELLGDYRFGQQQLMEILGQACAVAITKAFPLSTLSKKQPTILVICGPDWNGCVGLVCARYLRVFEYIPTVFYPKRTPRSPHLDFAVQCEKMDIPFLSYLPTVVQLINDAYNLVVDALLGPETELEAAKELFPSILLTLQGVKIPIASLDIPSGWDPDESNTDGISPVVLISLMAPKTCALSFSGTHFLAGRFLPYDIQKKYDLNLPKFPSTDCITELHF